MTLKVEVGGASTRGKREKQEDCFMTYHLIEELSSKARRFNVNTDRHVYMGVLCDGMGGEGNGAWCARQAVQKFGDTFAETGSFKDKWLERLYISLYAANAGVYEYKSALGLETNAGCTLVSAVIVDEKLYYISVGDSDIWLFRKNKQTCKYKGTRLNKHHSRWVKYEQGKEIQPISEEEAKRIGCNCPSDITIKKQPYAALLGREIGYLDTSEVNGFDLIAGDVVVLASDGVLQGMGNIQSSFEYVIWDCSSPGISAKQMASEIIQEIVSKSISKQDNASCVIFKIVDDKV